MPENKGRVFLIGALAGLVVTLPLIAVMYLGTQILGLPMLAYDLFERVTRIQQLGGVVTKAIDVMVGIFSSIPGIDTAAASKTAEHVSAVGLFLVLGALAGGLYALYYRRQVVNGGVGGWTEPFVVGWIVAMAIELSAANFLGVEILLLVVIWFGLIFFGWAYGLSRLTSTLLAPPAANLERRRFLGQFAGTALAMTVGAWGLGSLLGRRADNSAGKPIANAVPPSVTPSVATAEATAEATAANQTFAAVPGTRAEITPNAAFYRVDVNLTPPSVEEKSYKLTVDGTVNTPLSLTYADIRQMPATEQYATLECISNPVGGDLISSTLWTGVKLRDMLNKAGLKDGVVEIKFTCADGYTESLPLDSAMDERTLLTYAMNGEALSEVHGFPLRLYVPNRYGMKNPKWITEISALNKPYNGYWEDRFWDKDAIIKSTSVIDTIAKDKAAESVVPVGGIAFSGARGISKVEISVDNGPWREATIKESIAPLMWHLWRYDWKAEKGHHQLRVRTTDGQGQAQIEEVAGLHPSGASGYHSQDVDI